MGMKPVVYILMVAVIAIAVIGTLLVLRRGEPAAGIAGETSVGGQKPVAVWNREWRRLWTYSSGQAFSSVPAALHDGWVMASEDGQVQAIDRTGLLRWTHTFTNMPIVGSPAVAGSVVVLAGADGQAAGLDAASGQRRWQVLTSSPSMLNGPLAISVGDGWQVIFLSSDDGVLYCLNANDGKTVWESKSTNRTDGMLAGDRRYLAYGNCDSAVHIFETATGRQAASVPVGTDAQMAGGLAFDGACFYGGTRDGRLVAVAAVGRVAWESTLSQEQEFNTPVMVGDAVAMGSAVGDVFLFDAKTGKPRWRVSLAAEVTGMGVLDDALFVVAGGALQGLKLQNGESFMRHAIGDYVLGPVVNGDCVAVVDDGGNLIAFGGKQNRQAHTPSLRHDVTKSKNRNR